jgi:hypothetical protein
MSQFAGLTALTDAKYTFDSKPVHPRLRFNFDAVTCVNKKKGGRVVTVVKKTPLLESFPDLAELFDDIKDNPNTTRNDSTLPQVQFRVHVHL